MIKAVIFDCFGVLTTDVWKDYVSSLPEGIRLKVHDLNHRRGRGELSRKDFMDKIVSVIGGDIDEISKVIKPSGQKNTLLLEYINELKGLGYKIGLLSNVGSNWVREELLSVEDQKLFDDILLSYEVGMIKPDPEMYRLAAKRLGVQPDECLMIDDIGKYCEAARDTGMKAVNYEHFHQAKRAIEEILSHK